ncbi:uncharacterized protein LOC141827235 [Curcuma longa]|uniref:uncharacterized protein LOC141827235 n=1 Tax=Curcuma longa TaxID=136217 RepID=UPI003D9DF6EF
MAEKPFNHPSAVMPYSARGSPAVSIPAHPCHCRRQPLVSKETHKHKPTLSAQIAESIGQTAADCAAVLCCCPCGLAHLLYLTTVKLPAGLLRRALCGASGKTRRGVRFVAKRPGLLRNRVIAFDDDEDDDMSIHTTRLLVRLGAADDASPVKLVSPELVALEKEMSATFYGAGFWRSLSRKE